MKLQQFNARARVAYKRRKRRGETTYRQTAAFYASLHWETREVQKPIALSDTLAMWERMNFLRP